MGEAAARLAERDLSACRALVIDSDPTSRSVLISQLREFGVGDVAHFGRARDARRSLEAKKADFVLCEQTFHNDADTTGQELLDDLRRAQLLPYSSVFIIVTGEATYAMVAEAAESSLDGYLLKPHKPSVLFERLMQARRRKAVLKPIFDPIEAEDYARAAEVCALFFHKKASYGLFAARMGTDLMLRLGQHEQARQLFEAVLAEKPVPWAKLGIARSQLEAGKATQAITTLTALIVEDAKFVDAYDVLGRAQVELGNYALAIESYRTASELTPGSISRVQKYGILAFFMGDYKAAYRSLSQCAILGSDSKMFDYQSFVLLGFCCLYSKDRKVLTRCQDDLAKAVERQPDSERLRRFKMVVDTQMLLVSGQPDKAAELVARLAEALRLPSFDFEAACNLSLLLAQVAASDVPLPEAETWIRAIGMRYCRARALTEQLSNTLLRHPPFQDIVKACNADINTLASQCLSLSLAGNPRGAVERLYQLGQQHLNGKLIENAYMLLQRHGENIADAEALQAQVQALRQRFGISQARDVIGRDTVRRATSTTIKAIVQSSVAETAEEVGPAFAA